eukprot:SAG31_NODE_426_length_15814_cov_25.737066_4_plen_63_part_00
MLMRHCRNSLVHFLEIHHDLNGRSSAHFGILDVAKETVPKEVWPLNILTASPCAVYSRLNIS